MKDWGGYAAAEEVVDELVRVLGFCAAATPETNAMKFAAIDAAKRWRRNASRAANEAGPRDEIRAGKVYDDAGRVIGEQG